MPFKRGQMHADPNNLPPAGIYQANGTDFFRSGFIMARRPLMSMYQTNPKVNDPSDRRSYSSVPIPLGWPIRHDKPRKGAWGEIYGTKGQQEAEVIYPTWERNKVKSRRDREHAALELARHDLQRRMEVALYGAPRSRPVEDEGCPLEASL